MKCKNCEHYNICVVCNYIHDKCGYYEPTRPHGEWIENTRYKRKGKKFLDCSVCHYGENGDIICEVSKVPSYCPNCGARMKLKEGDDK